jgi:hypothetical protein
MQNRRAARRAGESTASTGDSRSGRIAAKENFMAETKVTPISGASSYHEIGEFWDQHDLADYESETREVELDVDIQRIDFVHRETGRS